MVSHSAATRAVILAAGAGRRLGAFSECHPKPLLEISGISILENCLAQLAGNAVTEVVLIVGHLREQIEVRIGRNFRGMRIEYVVSERYATTNNVYSLWCAREFLDRDILLLEADLFFDGALIDALQKKTAANVVAVARHKPGMDGTVVRLDAEGRLTALIEGAKQEPGFYYADTYKTVNIYRFSKEFLATEFVPALDRTIAAGQTGGYYELLLKETLAAGAFPLTALDCSGLRWYEIDDTADRRIAEYLFLSPDQRLEFLNRQYGSYWRYGVVDHSYLYNMHFPPQDMWTRLSREIEFIAKQYPVGQAALADLLSEVADQPPDRLVVANGASELIRIICMQLDRRIIVPVPSFNEYENATPEGALVRYELLPPDFRFDANGFAAAAEQSGATLAVIVSPNNPTGALVAPADLARLCARLDKAAIILVLDESFVDFCVDPAAQSLGGLLEKLPNLVILKSMSKVYGVGGLRLGYLASRNAEFLSEVRARLPIWNINGFAEAFLRLLPRYRREFKQSCQSVHRDSVEFARLLAAIPGVHVEVPQANFIFVRVPEGWTSDGIARRFFIEHDILVKHCARKSMPHGQRYLRVSTRSEGENRAFAEIFAAIIAGERP